MGSLSTASEWSSPNCKTECKSSFNLGNPQHNLVIYLYHSSECFCSSTFLWFNLFDCTLPGIHPGKISIILFTSVDIGDLHSKVMLLPVLLILFDLPGKFKCNTSTESPGQGCTVCIYVYLLIVRASPYWDHKSYAERLSNGSLVFIIYFNSHEDLDENQKRGGISPTQTFLICVESQPALSLRFHSLIKRIGNGVKVRIMTSSPIFQQFGAQLSDQHQHSTTSGSSKMPHEIPQQTSLVLKEDREFRASTLSLPLILSVHGSWVRAFGWEKITNILLSSSWASNAELRTFTRIPQDKNYQYYPI